MQFPRMEDFYPPLTMTARLDVVKSRKALCVEVLRAATIATRGRV
jgi:hypothetical protein